MCGVAVPGRPTRNTKPIHRAPGVENPALRNRTRHYIMRFGDAWPVVTLGCAQRRATKRNNSPTDGTLEQADAVVMGESTTVFYSIQ